MLLFDTCRDVFRKTHTVVILLTSFPLPPGHAKRTLKVIYIQRIIRTFESESLALRKDLLLEYDMLLLVANLGHGAEQDGSPMGVEPILATPLRIGE